MDLVEMCRQSFTYADPVTLAKAMAAKYSRIRYDVNANLMPGYEPLPEWNGASILDHIRMHNNDPEVQLWVMQTDTR